MYFVFRYLYWKARQKYWLIKYLFSFFLSLSIKSCLPCFNSPVKTYQSHLSAAASESSTNSRSSLALIRLKYFWETTDFSLFAPKAWDSLWRAFIIETSKLTWHIPLKSNYIFFFWFFRQLKCNQDLCKCKRVCSSPVPGGYFCRWQSGSTLGSKSSEHVWTFFCFQHYN